MGKEVRDGRHLGSLQSLAVELRRENLTVDEAAAAVCVHRVLRRCGVREEECEDVIVACAKMHSEGFLASAAKLSQVTDRTGPSYEEVATECQKKEQQLARCQTDLRELTAQTKLGQQSLKDISRKKKLDEQEFDASMQRLGLDASRLRAVEGLAAALKAAGVGDAQLGNYLRNLSEVNEAHISLGLLAELLQKVKVLTVHDHGQALLKMLVDYGGLRKTITVLRATAGELEVKVSDLEKKLPLKAQVEADLVKVRTREAALKQSVAGLSKDRETLARVQDEVASLAAKRDSLVRLIGTSEGEKRVLLDLISELQKKISDLEELQVRHDRVSAGLAEMDDRISSLRSELEVFHGFLGLIQPSSFSEMERFAKVLPDLLAQVKKEGHSLELLRDYVHESLTANTLRVYTCGSCGAKFGVDKPAKSFLGHSCPACPSSSVKIVVSEAEILQDALYARSRKAEANLSPGAAQLSPGQKDASAAGPTQMRNRNE